MKALVVYDSFFGNTEQVAHAIGRALGPQEEVTVLRVGDVEPQHLAGLDVLVVGSPTRAFSPTPATRKLVGGIPRGGLAGVKVAAFDTRMDIDQAPRILRALVKVFGYAAEPLASRLKKKGGEQAVPPGGFIVEGTEGPMRDGELERAAEWAGGIIASQ
ncbi:MAG: flavodoxin family protein [Anaerolineae bacterium]|nr:flavodoxin family protein [Anaerolineae bacterium]